MTITQPNKTDKPDKQKDKNSLSNILHLEETITQSQEILTKTNNNELRVHRFSEELKVNKMDKNGQRGFWCSDANFTSIKLDIAGYINTNNQLNRCINVLRNVVTEEGELTANRRQEEALDLGNKWRSFWLRAATTSGTIIIGILLLNLALYLKLDVPRILTPDIPSKMLVTPKMLQTEVLNLRRELGHLKAKLEASSVKPDTVSVAVTLDRPDKLKQSDVVLQQ